MGQASGGGLIRQTENAFLNMYEADAVRRDGSHFPYYFATRRRDGDLMYQTGELKADGVVIYAVCKSQPDKLVLIRQFRYPVNQYIYELPAGLIDEGENAWKAAGREMKEETGLDFEPFTDYPDYLKRPFIQAQGMSDECDITVFGYADGRPGRDLLEANEDIQVVLADRKEVRRILAQELVSIRGAYLMTAFLRSDGREPFAFLQGAE